MYSEHLFHERYSSSIRLSLLLPCQILLTIVLDSFNIFKAFSLVSQQVFLSSLILSTNLIVNNCMFLMTNNSFTVRFHNIVHLKYRV